MLKRMIAATAMVAGLLTFAAAAEKALTSQDVLKKMSEVYRAANTWYEEGTFVYKRDGQTMPQSSGKYTLAFRRPDTFKWETNAGGGLALFHKDGTLTAVFCAKNKYENYSLDLDKSLIWTGLPGTRLRFAADPYEYIAAHAVSVGPLSETSLDDKRVYAVDLSSPGQTQKLYIDAETFRVVGVDGQNDEDTMTLRMTRMLVDELPRDADGKPVDVFAFSLPAGATEIREQEAAGKPQ